MYRIGEFSKLVKLTVKALRFYDETGLLKPSLINRFTNYRYYTTKQLFPAQQIIALRQAGFSIEEIKRVLSGKDVSDLLKKKQEALTIEKEQLQEQLTRLNSIIKYYSEEQTMNYQAIVKDLPEYVVYYKRCKVKNFEQYGTLIPSIGEEISKANPTLKCSDPGFCYVEYLDGEFKETDFNIEYAEAVEKVGKAVNGIQFKTLPAMKVACVMHKGSYDKLGKAYAYLMEWVESNGYTSNGNAREQYIDGCWNRENPDEYLTEVQIPIQK